ncbi:uncharacterized protein LOC5501084 [Nematostella vectensis]|uniref:uncharacterized protein LOC5501084 n=1 Tax=Nematostella vectensis TaxID=45351 RepID=UPI002077127B|nr:uncharacterized protein LOC5501084 [Nematostella vectensis]
MATTEKCIEKLAQKAKKAFVSRRFQKTIWICRDGLQTLQAADIEQNAQHWKICLGILSIQAFVEMGERQKADHFATTWFGEVEDFPAEILKLCICSHIWASEFEEATNLAELWLSNKSNQESVDIYAGVIELYMKNVVIPHKGIKKAETFIFKNPVLPESKKQELIDITHKSSKQKDTSNMDYDNKNDIERINSDGKGTNKPFFGLYILQMLRMFNGQANSKSIIKTLARATILLLCLYLLLARSDNQGSGQVSLWRAVQQAWTALFAPYHLMQSQ